MEKIINSKKGGFELQIFYFQIFYCAISGEDIEWIFLSITWGLNASNKICHSFHPFFSAETSQNFATLRKSAFSANFSNCNCCVISGVIMSHLWKMSFIKSTDHYNKKVRSHCCPFKVLLRRPKDHQWPSTRCGQ